MMLALCLALIGAVFATSSNATAPAPSWWDGDCDSGYNPGSHALGASYNGVKACGPGPNYGGNVVYSQSGGFSAYEWYCVELSMRYMYLAYGINTYYLRDNAAYNIVDDYPGTLLKKVPNDGNSLPSPGDILAIGPNPYSLLGHTSVVTSVTSSQVGTMEENGDPANGGAATIPVTNGKLEGYVTGWLHYPSGNSGVADGTFVKTAASASVYLVAGGAPVPLTSWTHYGGTPRPVTTITQAQLDSMPKYPANGTCIKQYGSSKTYVVVGGSTIYISDWAFMGGSKPTVTVPDNSISGYFLKYPAGGTLVREYGTAPVYSIAGGMAIHVISWDSIGGDSKKSLVVTIPTGSVSTKFIEYSLDGTLVREYGTAPVYLIAGGMAIHVPSWDSIGGVSKNASVVTVPTSSVNDSYLQYSKNGTYVREYGTASVYVIAGGSGLHIINWDNVGGSHASTTVEIPADTFANSYLPYPADGTFVQGYLTGKIYEVNGGYATLLTDWGPDGPQPVTIVDQLSIDNELHATE